MRTRGRGGPDGGNPHACTEPSEERPPATGRRLLASASGSCDKPDLSHTLATTRGPELQSPGLSSSWQPPPIVAAASPYGQAHDVAATIRPGPVATSKARRISSPERGAFDRPSHVGTTGPRTGRWGSWIGSPPRAWGQLVLRVRHLRQERFTPTRVGTTPDARLASTPRTVHPHARGDDVTPGRGQAGEARFTPTRVGTTPAAGLDGAPQRFTPTRVGTTTPCRERRPEVVGSPPRAWGRRPRSPRRRPGPRFTPTRVGTTDVIRARRTRCRSPVHPHARGDDVGVTGPAARASGSPPRAWGRRRPRRRPRALRRFTPTRVGTTHRAAVGLGCYGSPPRAWGRRRAVVGRQRRRIGSPPRAWGRRPDARVMHRSSSVHPHARGDDASRRARGARRRFTPTRVGTTRRRTPARERTPVHPHARGDDCARRVDVAGRYRFTPTRVGTTIVARMRDRALARFTPTRVGTTSDRGDAPMRRPVHPHARGDDASHWRCARAVAGSPPRAWGRRRHGRRPVPERFTPTRVGTTPLAARAAGATVHPHARGDDHGRASRPALMPRFTPTRVGTTSARDSVATGVGSPPRAWGRRRAGRGRRSGDRFTPTRVGTTRRAVQSAHRARRFTPTRVGTTPARARATGRAHGSPPRAWGRRRRPGGSSRRAGSPPRAWGRRARMAARRVASVHPHARGDDAHAIAPSARRVGSPPRAWGRRAGRQRIGAAPAHPHARGDDVTRTGVTLAPAPVHPHARGDDCRRNPGQPGPAVHPHARGDDCISG